MGFILKTKSVTPSSPHFFCISDKGNSLSDCRKGIKKSVYFAQTGLKSPVSEVWSHQEHYPSSLDGMLVHHRIPSMKPPGVLPLLPGWDARPSQGTQHDTTRSITTPPWMGCQFITGYPAWCHQEHYYSSLDGMPVHHRIPSMMPPGALLLLPGWDASPSQGTQHDATRSITTPPWMGC